jgi:hypothetical protein
MKDNLLETFRKYTYDPKFPEQEIGLSDYVTAAVYWKLPEEARDFFLKQIAAKILNTWKDSYWTVTRFKQWADSIPEDERAIIDREVEMQKGKRV